MLNRILVAAAVSVIPAVTFAAPILVDDFSTVSGPIYPIVDTTVGTAVVAPLDASAGAIGGVRQATVQLDSAVIAGLDSVQVGVFAVGSGLYDYNSTSGAAGRGVLSYGDSAGGVPLSPLVIPDGSTLDITFLSFDMPSGGNILLNVLLNNGVLGGAIGFSVTTAGAQTVSVPLDSLPTSIRNNVTGIGVLFAGSTAVDFRVDTIAITIPEPSALGLLAPAGLLLARRRR